MKLAKRILALALCACLLCTVFSGCGTSADEPIHLTIYSGLANFSGEQGGWGAQLMLDKFNVVLTIIPDGDGVYETRMEDGFLGDIVIFGSDGENYTRALEAGMLYDWNYDNLLEDYGPYIYENMQAALDKNAKLNESVTGEYAVYGFGHNVAQSSANHESFFYTWDIRWDLYKELGYPEVNDLDDMLQLFLDMKEICPTDDNGNETYAVTMWPDWDGDMVMYIKAFATSYWGYEGDQGLGLYNVENGEFYGALEPDGPYMESLRFFNKMYQNGLVDPNSMTQLCENAGEKVQAGGAFFSIFNYAGSLQYNTDEHLAEGKLMASLVPTEGSPITYGMSTSGGNRLWCIGSDTAHPELCMEIINWLCTPEGVMTYNYGPQGLCWDYDEEGYTYLTEFGHLCRTDSDTQMIGEYEGTGNYSTGVLQHANTTFSLNAVNPDSPVGETFNCDTWKSTQNSNVTPIEQDWRDFTGASSVQEYMENTDYTVAVATTYSMSPKTGEFKTTWSAVTDVIVTYSWKAIYATSDEEFDQIVAEMTDLAKSYGYDECIEWCETEAAARHALEEQVKSMDN